MVFTLNLLYSILCTYSFSKSYRLPSQNRYLYYMTFLSPVWIIWLVICGGQYYVGTDYESYYEIFSSLDTEYYKLKYEYVFAYIVELCGLLNFPPQTLFYIFYFIGISFLIYIASRLEHRTSFIFILLYLSVSTIFHNQLNTLRLFTASYIVSTATLVLFDKKGILKFLTLIIFASAIHLSSIFFISFIILKYKLEMMTYKSALYLLLISIIILFIGDISYLYDTLNFILPMQYRHYIGSTFDTSSNIILLISKLIYVPIYFYSAKLLLTHKLLGLDLYLFKVGYLFFCLRLILLNNTILNRFGDMLILLSMLPIYYLLRDLYLNKRNIIYYLICMLFIIFYLIKVLVIPKQEYLYNSIYI